MEPINPNEPFIVRSAIMKLAVIMEMKLRTRAEDYSPADSDSHILNKCPGQFNSMRMLSKMREHLDRMIEMRNYPEFPQNNGVFYNTLMIDYYIDVCTYGLFIANAFWNRQDNHMNAFIQQGGEVEHGPEIITQQEADRRAEQIRDIEPA